MASCATSGTRLPDFEYHRPDGSEARISQLWSDGPALFVWMRHCGCVFFAEALAQLRAQAERLRRSGVRLGLIVQARPEDLAEVCGHTPHLVCIPDPELETHRAIGLGRASLWTLLTSRAFHRRRSEAGAKGHRQHWRRTFARESDTLMNPAAALVAPGGRILWIHRGEHPGDLPAADVLLAFVQEHWDPKHSERRPY